NLEIRYRDQNNPDMLLSVQYQGDALRKKVQELYNQYQVETGKVTAISTKFGLDATDEETGLVEFEQYVKEIDRNRNQQDELNRIIDFPIRRSARLSFLMSSDNGVYGDRIECFGYYFSLYGYRVEGVPGQEVTVFLDNAPVSSTITDELGSYNVIIPIERIPAGPHSLYAQSGTTLSDIQTLTVQSVGSTTTLSVTRPNSKGDVTCTGSVTANRPVRFALIQLVWDTTHIVETSTDAQGQFKATLRFPEGRHTVVARFSGDGFPITVSESKPQVVDVSILRIIPSIISPDTNWEIPMVIAGTLLLFAGIAWYYLRRIPGRRSFDLLMGREPSPRGTPATDLSSPYVEPGADEPGQPSAGTSPPHDESVLARYARILNAEGLSAAAWVVYRQFAGRVAHELFIPKHTALTPRELSHSCIQRPFCRAFSSFVSTYELIRYGGQRSVAMQAEFETRIHSTQSELEDGSP
ncbi:MAG: carboxypeptidase-like regulatory domain-containing protein, partial [Methanoregulaceae archaeon]|nr:carboxypeptidase-like regulatory domain-containing protein [Methanoregulaceae archaeon]